MEGTLLGAAREILSLNWAMLVAAPLEGKDLSLAPVPQPAASSGALTWQSRPDVYSSTGTYSRYPVELWDVTPRFRPDKSATRRVGAALPRSQEVLCREVSPD